jgi:hypothetical protein
MTSEATKPQRDPSVLEWAITQDIRLNTLVDECGKVDSTLIKDGQQLKSQWRKNYWKALNAADHEFNRLQGAKIYTYNGEKISLPAAKLMVEKKQAALQEFNYQKRMPDKQIAFCQSRMTAFSTNQDGLGNPADAGRLAYLNELAAKAPMAAPGDVPSLAGNLSLATPGGALYHIEKESAKNQCSDGKVLTLHNEHNRELYGVYCKGAAGYFVTCEWSDCSTLGK